MTSYPGSLDRARKDVTLGTRYEPSEGVFLYLLGLVVIMSHVGRFWLGFTLAMVPLLLGGISRGLRR